MRSFPWDSIVEAMGDDGYPIYDRAYTASDLQEVYRTFFSNGVFLDTDEAFQVLSGDGMSVNVQPGKCHINGVVGFEKSARNLVVQASTTQGRYDTVVLRFNANLESRSIDLYVKQGTAAATPVRPTLTRSDTVWELGLCDILVTANSTSVAQERVTDTRLDPGRCGIVAPFEKLDTTTFYNQLQAALDKQVGELQEQTDKAVELANAALDGTVVGQIYEAIDERVGLGSGAAKLESADVGGLFDQDGKHLQITGEQKGEKAQVNINSKGDITFFDGFEVDSEHKILWHANLSKALQALRGTITDASFANLYAMSETPGTYLMMNDAANNPSTGNYCNVFLSRSAGGRMVCIAVSDSGAVYTVNGYENAWSWVRIDVNGAGGILPISRGGTGASTMAGAVHNLFPNTSATATQVAVLQSNGGSSGYMSFADMVLKLFPAGADGNSGNYGYIPAMHTNGTNGGYYSLAGLRSAIGITFGSDTSDSNNIRHWCYIGNVLIQWGYAHKGDQGAHGYYSYQSSLPKPYKDAHYTALVSPYWTGETDGDSLGWTSLEISDTQKQILKYAAGNGTASTLGLWVYWMTIGYWK